MDLFGQKRLHFNGVITKIKRSEYFQKNFGFLFFIEKLGDLEALVSLLALIRSLIQQYLLRFYYVPGTFLGIQKNERTKSGKNQLKISAATSVYKYIILSVLSQHLPLPTF